MEHHQFHALAPLGPLILQRGRGVLVDLDVDRPNVGGQRARVAKRLHHGTLQASDRHDGDMPAGRLRYPPAQRQVRGHLVVVTARDLEDGDQDRNHHDDDPGALGGFGHRHDDEHDAGHHGAKPVDERIGPPPWCPERAPMNHHARLRDRERDKDADHVQRDERVGVAAEHHQQQAGERAENQDAVGEGQAVALVHELAGQKAVAGDDGGQAREVGIRRVGRQDQDQHRGCLDAVVEDVAPAEDGARHLRDHGLMLGGNHGVCLRQ